MTEAGIYTIRCEGIAVNDNNYSVTENFMQSYDVLPPPLSTNFGSHDVNPWRQSGNLPVGRSKLNMTPIPLIQNISRLKFFMKFYFMDYIKDVFIPETSKLLNSAMNFSEYFCVIFCHLIMACYVGHYIRDFFLKDTITPQKGAPIRLNHIISRRRLDNTTQVMSYKNIEITELNELDFWRHLVWEMVDNTLDEETESGGVNGRRPREMRRALGDHDLLTAPKYCGKCIVDENKWRRIKNP